MHHLVVLVGNYGETWRHLPVVAHDSRDVFAFVDHRNNINDRQLAVHAVVPYSDIGSVEVVITDPPPESCDVAHDYRGVTRGSLTVAARCVRCGFVEKLAWPTPISQRLDRFCS